MYCASTDISVNWTISTTQVTEGEGMEVTLTARAFGLYANLIEIGVICVQTVVTGVEPGMVPI